MRIEAFSKKQLDILRFILDEGDTLICDGAVRSGKTIVMSIAFIIWAMKNFNQTNFGICGKTVSNAERNILKPLQQVEGLPYSMKYKLSNRMLIVKCKDKENYFYLFGGKDESSYMLIQGITLAGCLFDEVALMPKSFVDQAIARTLSYSNAKVWFNCNPDHPNHWFYKEWILDETKQAKHLHFLMTDNPILTNAEIKRAKKMFTGVFYDRYIRGLWVLSDGLIYKKFASEEELFYVEKKDLPHLQHINIGVDIGGNKSKHAFVASGTDKDYDCLYVLKTRCFDAKGTDTDMLTNEFKRFAHEIQSEYGFLDVVYSDSAEQTIKNTFRNKTDFCIRDSIKNEIIDRIRCEDILMAQNRLKLVKGECGDLAEAFRSAVWDPKKQEDIRLDDGSYNLDVIDAFEYSWERFMKGLIRS